MTENHGIDFFAADAFDDLLVKDDMASMEHPVFSLAARKDANMLTYVYGESTIRIGAVHGLPTIFDKDVLLYCGSILMEQINKGILPQKTIRFSAHDLLITTNRLTNGRSYERLKEALERLTGCTIITNIKTDGRRQREGFHIIDKYRVIEKSPTNNRMMKLEITLSDWFYHSLIGKEVLTINRDYFQLRKPLERRLYEIARKHCGDQPEFTIGLEKLHKKTGSMSELKYFRFQLRKSIVINQLPDYNISLNDNDIVRFSQKECKDDDDAKLEQAKMDAVKRRIRPDTVERLRDLVKQYNITRAAGEAGFDFYALYEDYIYSVKTGRFKPDDINAALDGFIKKKLGIKNKK